MPENKILVGLKESSRSNVPRRKSIRLQSLGNSGRNGSHSDASCNIFSSTINSNSDLEGNLKVLVPETPNRCELSSISIPKYFKGATTVLDTPDELSLKSPQIFSNKTKKRNYCQLENISKLQHCGNINDQSNNKKNRFTSNLSRASRFSDASDSDSSESIENFNNVKRRNVETLLEESSEVSLPKVTSHLTPSLANKKESVVCSVGGGDKINGLHPHNWKRRKSVDSSFILKPQTNDLPSSKGVSQNNNLLLKNSITNGIEDLLNDKHLDGTRQIGEKLLSPNATEGSIQNG